MKMPLAIFLSVLIFLAFGNCKKDTQSNSPTPNATDPLDTIIGTYTGTMHISNESIFPGHMWSPDSSTPPVNRYWGDTSYISSFVFSKVSADTFSTGGLFDLFSFSSGSTSQIIPIIFVNHTKIY